MGMQRGIIRFLSIKKFDVLFPCSVYTRFMLTSVQDFLAEATSKRQVVGTWGFNSNRDFSKVSPEETNVWFFEQVFNFLRSFFGLVLPDNLEIITYNATKHLRKENLEQQTFLDELMLMMKGLKESIWTLRLNLNLVGFLRTHHNPDQVVRIQIQEPSSFIAWGGPDETGFQNFSISYTLFNESVLEGSDEMIWSVNQPILEKALKKWERQTGQMIQLIDANTTAAPVYRHGFRKPMRRRPMLKRRPVPPMGATPGVVSPRPVMAPASQRPQGPIPPRPPIPTRK